MSPQPLKALLLTSPGCVHCASLKKTLEKFVSEGLIVLEVVDVAGQPEVAQRYGIKSVPWLKLGPLEFSGAQHEPELRIWVTRVHSTEGVGAYLKYLLETDDLELAIKLIRENPEWISSLLLLVADEDKDIKLQLGVSAIFEEFEGQPLLQDNVDKLGKLATHDNPRIRADVAHFLALSHSEKARGVLQQLVQDSDREVREIASEGLCDASH